MSYRRWIWERSYAGHVLRDARAQAIGRIVRLGRPAHGYAWQTAGCRGTTGNLRKAKELVIEAIRRNVRQGELFAYEGFNGLSNIEVKK